MSMSSRRVRAIARKELREYRRNRQLVVSMAILPLVVSIYPFIEIFALPASASSSLLNAHPLIYMLAIPAIVPGTLAAYAVAGERQQDTLEPMLSTPIARDELLLGKALAVLMPALAVSYGVCALFALAVDRLARPPVAAAVLRGPDVLGLVLFTPLVAAFSIWVGIAISARSSDPRVASQLSVLASLPSIIVTTVIAVGGIQTTLGLVLGLAAVLLLLDGFGWRIVSATFNRERLITGTR